MQSDSTPVPHSPPPSSRSPRRLAGAPLRLEIAARTDRGQHREHNEDSFVITSAGAGVADRSDKVDVASRGWVALAVCDGMGGAAAGEVASRAAAEIIGEVIAAGGEVTGSDDLGWRVIDSIEEASRRVHAAAEAQRSLRGMGTTATVCALHLQDLFMGQVGDSRAYLLRAGRLTQLTRDQTLATLLEENGQLSPEEKATFEHGHVILQAVGTTEHVDVDLRRVTVRRGDVLLICSDGLHGPLSDDEIRDLLERASSSDAACEALIDEANAAGGPDNITCIVVRIEGDALSARPDPVLPERVCLDPTPRDTRDPSTEPTVDVLPPGVVTGEGDASDRGAVETAIARLLAVFKK